MSKKLVLLTSFVLVLGAASNTWGDLVAHWKLDEGSGDTAFDSSGNNYHATLVNNPVWVPGKIGAGALNLEAGGYGGIQGLFYQGSGFPEVSVCAWIRTSSSGGQYIVSFDRNEYYRLEINGEGAGDGQVGWDVMTDAGQNDYGSVARVDDGRWHHVAGVFDNGTSTIYVDGDPQPSASLGTTFGDGTDVRYGYLGVGSESTAFDLPPRTPASFFDGDMDEVYIYHRALTPAEIAYLADDTPGDSELYIQVPSIADLHSEEPILSRSVNFKDFAVLADQWLDEQLWP